MDPLRPVIDRLHQNRLRVWSLVITVFGDAVNPRGGEVAALRLQVLFERLGVEPGTLRTALSRLARDGWIERERTGRTALYRLSRRGSTEFAPATERIYRAPAEPEDWTLGTGTPPPGAHVQGALWLAPGEAGPATGLRVTGRLGALGDDDRKAFLSEARAEELAQLANDIRDLSPLRLAPLDAMAARTVLIHRWRRIVLANADLPDAIRPASLPGRAAVADLYATLLPPSEAWLDDPALPALGPPAPQLARRFRT